MASLIDFLTDELAPALQPPYVFFGHSMGALVSFELACRLRAQGRIGPDHLIVSGFRAPHLRDRRLPIHDLPDADIMERLRELGGTPEEVLANTELMALMLPVVRADLALCERYMFRPREALNCSLTALSGTNDVHATVEEVCAWGRHTTGPFAFQIFPGNHFFFHSNTRSAVLSVLAQDLWEVLRRTGSDGLAGQSAEPQIESGGTSGRASRRG
jgi:medium-chain acyl-[acyl-carrier-protein] hydrolase